MNYTDFTSGVWKWIGLQNFRELPDIPGWSLMLRNTWIFLVGSIVPQFLIGGLLAVMLRESSRIRRFARTWCCWPGCSQPFNYLVIQSGLQAIFRDLHESAMIDGASWVQELLRITVPMLRETLITVIMVGITGTMNVSAFVWILTQGGPANGTMPPGLFAYQVVFTNLDYGEGAAVILPIVGVLLVVAVAHVLLTGQLRRRLPVPGRPAPLGARIAGRSGRAEAPTAGAAGVGGLGS